MFLLRTRLLRQLTTSSQVPSPWFVDVEPEHSSPSSLHRPQPTPPLPENVPPQLKDLHAVLENLPHLESSTLTVREGPLSPTSSFQLPVIPPRGRRRKRGGSYFGDDVFDASSGIWNWVVLAQVKEGVENRGAIGSVVRVIRETLLTTDPPIVLPPNSRRRVRSGWAMLDGGRFAVHILSRESKEKYFPDW